MRLRVRPFPGRPATPPADSVGERSETTRGLDHLAANGLRRPDRHVGQFHRRNIDAAILFVIAGDPCEAGVACILPLRFDGDDVALLDHGLAPFGWKHWPDARMARKKARHFRRAKVLGECRESRRSQARSIYPSVLLQFTHSLRL